MENLCKRQGVEKMKPLTNIVRNRGYWHQWGIRPLPNAISEVDIAWLAGIIDGDGCISVVKVGTKEKRGFRARVVVGNTSFTMIERIYDLVGFGYVNKFKTNNNNHKDVYQWVLQSQRAASFLATVYPYLVVKQKQANWALKVQINNLRCRNFGDGPFKKVTSPVIKYRRKAYGSVSALNRVGKPKPYWSLV